MTDVTPPQAAEAVTAAAVAIHDADCPDTGCSGSALGHAYRLANAALAAASPTADKWLERYAVKAAAKTDLLGGQEVSNDAR